MNRIDSEKRVQIVSCLVEGMSIRATCRITGAAKGTVTKLLLDLGTVCSIHQDWAMRDLTCERVQVDEIWSFVYAKQKNVPDEKRGEAGDVWTWVAIDADTKLVPTYRVGSRDLEDALGFIHDLTKRISNRMQLTSDGNAAYLAAVKDAKRAGRFPDGIDYAQLQKIYGQPGGHQSGRYSQPPCIGAKRKTLIGSPDPDHVSTSYVERQNLTMRMSMRRFTRLTNGFSKKMENLAAAVSLHFMHYNFCRVHKSLGTTPAVAAGVADHVWSISEIIALLEAAEATPIKRGPYKKRG